MSEKNADPVMTFDDVNRKTEQFGALLESIENLEDKKKHLWREIYENAVVDRMNAYISRQRCFFLSSKFSMDSSKAPNCSVFVLTSSNVITGSTFFSLIIYQTPFLNRLVVCKYCVLKTCRLIIV